MCLGLPVALLAAGKGRAEDDPRRVILDASRALQAGSAARFLSYFDKDGFEQFAALRRDVTVLVETRTVASSVEITSLSADGDARQASVDWLLQLTPASGPGPLERRREALQLRIAKRGKSWKIEALKPADFFRPR